MSGENRRLQLCVRSGLALLDYCTGRWAALDDSLDAVIEELSGDPRAWLDARVAADCLRLLRSGSVEAYRALAGTVAHAVELGGVDLVWIPASVWLRFALSRGDVAAGPPSGEPASATTGGVLSSPGTARLRTILSLMSQLFGRVALSVPQHCLKEVTQSR